MLHYGVVVLFMAGPASPPPTVGGAAPAVTAGELVPVKAQLPFTVLGKVVPDGPVVPLNPASMQPLNPPGPCPPKCLERLLAGGLTLDRVGLLFRPAKGTQLERL